MVKAALIVLLALVSATALAETPEQFVERMQGTPGVQAVVNQRNDGSFGSVSIGVQPDTVQNRGSLEPLLADIAKFAAAGGLKVSVLSPSQPDTDFITAKLKESGLKNVATRVMAPGVSIQVTRIFLSADTMASPGAGTPGAGKAPKAAKSPPAPKEK